MTLLRNVEFSNQKIAENPWNAVSNSSSLLHFKGFKISRLVSQKRLDFDWCCFYYFVRKSLVALLEALCARKTSLFQSWLIDASLLQPLLKDGRRKFLMLDLFRQQRVGIYFHCISDASLRLLPQSIRAHTSTRTAATTAHNDMRHRHLQPPMKKRSDTHACPIRYVNATDMSYVYS